MNAAPTTLTQELARLRQSAEADQAHGWLPAALHALIMACLARLFVRLEQTFLLWTAGQLPPQHPAAPPIARPAPNTPRPGICRTSRRDRRYRRITRAIQATRRATSHAPAPRPARPRSIPAPKPPQHSRAPPSPRHPIRRDNRPARIADPRPI